MTSALDIAAAVRTGKRSAREVLDEHLAVVDARDGELHAFNLVLAEEARVAADAIDARVAAGEDPGPLAGVPLALKDNLCTRGIATTCSSKILDGWQPPYRRHGRRASWPRPAPCSSARPTSMSSPWAPPPRTRPSVPAGTRTTSTSVPGGSSGGSAVGRGRGHGIDRPRLRHRRLHPPARRALRRRRHEADLRPGVPLRARSPSRRRSTRSARSPPPWPTPPPLFEVIAGHDPRDSTSIPERPPEITADPARRRGRAPHRAGDRADGRRGMADDVLARTREAAAALEAAGATVGRGVDPRRRLRHHRLLPGRPGRGVQQPGPLRRRPLRPPGRRRRPRRT